MLPKEYAEAGARLRDWVDKGYIDADSLAMTREDATSQFYLQKGLFAFVNNNELTDLEKNSAEAGFEIGVMAFLHPKARLPCFTTLVLTDSWFTPVPSIRNSPQDS